MYREHILALLKAYAEAWPDEAGVVDRTRDFVRRHKNCFLRSCRPGHITASAWILSPGHDRFLLTHHRKLGRWLQLGGHADGEPEAHRVALREATEESGMYGFELLHGFEPLLPLDLDVHRIPPHGDDPEHFHYDLRFLLRARAGEEPRGAGTESHDVRWFTIGELEGVASEASILRMSQKARAVLAGRGMV